MHRSESYEGISRAIPAIILIGAASLTACQADDLTEREGRTHGTQSPDFDCKRANYFQLAGSEGYIRADAVRSGEYVQLDSVQVTAPGTTYDETFAVNGDGVAQIARNVPIPRRAGEITIRGIFNGDSDLCSTVYYPLREYTPPDFEEPKE